MTLKKKDVLKLVKNMPHNLNPDELMYRIYLAKKIEQGERDIRAGRVIPHETVKKEIRKWFK